MGAVFYQHHSSIVGGRPGLDKSDINYCIKIARQCAEDWKTSGVPTKSQEAMRKLWDQFHKHMGGGHLSYNEGKGPMNFCLSDDPKAFAYLAVEWEAGHFRRIFFNEDFHWVVNL